MTHFLGLTGSIGMGKSTTAQMFRDEGIPVWDADAAVHALYEKGGNAVGPVGAALPDAIVDGAVDRNALRQMIAKDPSVITTLEKLVHPLVAEHRKAFLDQHKCPLVVLDIPLLFETGAETWLSSVLVVTAPADVQKARVLARPGMTEDQFNLILSRRTPDAEKRARADHIVDTGTDLATTQRAVSALVAQLRTDR